MTQETDYMNWVRTLPCAITGYIGEEIDPSHLEGMSWLTGKSGSSKGSYLTCIPLRHNLHLELHRIGWKSFEKKHNISQLELAMATVIEANKQGILVVSNQ